MSPQVNRILFAILLVLTMAMTGWAQNNLTAKSNGLTPVASVSTGSETDRARDGLMGPVRRVRTEIVRLSTVNGTTVEDKKRVLLETAEYDLKGIKTQNQFFPIAGATLTGREVYKYDDRGNISEMTLVGADGSLVGKEVYKYDFDSVGNWIKMTTSVAVVENGKIGFDPSEATYRTIFYYLDATMATMTQPGGTPNSAPKSANVPSPTESERKMAASPPPSSLLLKSRTLASSPVVANVVAGSPDLDKTILINGEPPPPKPLLKPLSGGVLNGRALTLPPPVYPDAARRMHVAGLVEVEVVVDEAGKVISARALSGPALLRDVAVQAASRARFTPTKLSGQPVKVEGKINYSFVLPR